MTTFRSRRFGRSVSFGVLALLLSSATGFTQEGGGPHGESAGDESGATLLDPIVITARKRPEFDLDVPVSTTILPGNSIPSTTLDPAGDISRMSPNLNFTDAARPQDRYGTMRGVGPLGNPLNSLDNTVGFAIGGVPTSSNGFGQPLFDIERVEVLRGPQGTLFGRNSLGGLINVIPREADGEREFRIDTQIGSNGYRQAEAKAGGWIVPDLLAGRAAFLYQNFDGDVPNGIIGGKEGGVDLKAGRGSLRFTPDETLVIDITGSYSSDDRNNAIWLLRESPDFPRSGVDRTPINNRDIGQGSIQVKKEFEDVDLVTVTSFQDIELFTNDDATDGFIYGALTGLPPAAFTGTDGGSVREKERIFSQELRLGSLEGSPFSWVAGVNYFRSDYNISRDFESDFIPTLNGLTNNDIVSQTFAVFGDVTIPLAERFEVSGGLRLAHDIQDFAGRFNSRGAPGLVPSFDQEARFSDTYVTGRAAVSYAWTDDIKSYFSVARGHSSGGFERSQGSDAPMGIAATPFAPTRGWTYELGTKAQLTNAISLSAAAFYNDVSDGQLLGFDFATNQVFIANQDYRSFGFELQGNADMSNGFELSAGVGFTESRLVGASTPVLPASVDGNRVPFTPEWTANLGVTYRLAGEDVGLDGDFFAGATYQYVGARYPDVQNSVKMDSYHMINAKIGWENERLGVNAFVNNLLDERPVYFAASYSPDVTGVIAGRGRVFGVGASLKW